MLIFMGAGLAFNTPPCNSGIFSIRASGIGYLTELRSTYSGYNWLKIWNYYLMSLVRSIFSLSAGVSICSAFTLLRFSVLSVVCLNEDCSTSYPSGPMTICFSRASAAAAIWSAIYWRRISYYSNFYIFIASFLCSFCSRRSLYSSSLCFLAFSRSSRSFSFLSSRSRAFYLCFSLRLRMRRSREIYWHS